MADPLDLLRSSLAGQYRVERQLGQGGMAVVFLAHDVRHGRDVALKVLRPDTATAIGAERFLLEVRIAANLRHPHILPLLDSGTVPGPGETPLPFYVMPLATGETLRARLDREGSLPAPEAVGLARQVAQALAYAHREGVVHRDIKPDNIFLEDGQAVVSDFGIARAASVAGADRLTQTGLAVGTPAYMSPEQLRGRSELDGRSDQYSLACVLVEMLTGRLPLPGVSARESLGHPAAGAAPGLPGRLVPVLDRALAPSPDDRFPTMAEFADALGAAITGDDEVPRPAPGRASGGRWLLGGAGVALAAALAVMFLRNPGAGPANPSAPGTPGAIAVMPFEVRGGPEFTYLGAGLVDLLSTTLDGAGGHRTVDRRAIVNAAGEQAPGVDEAGRVARRFGADLFVLGNLVEAGGRLRLTATLHRTAGGPPLARASAEGRADAIFEVVDSLTVKLLTAWGESQSGRGGLAARTTTSLPALRAWLDGEAALRALRFEDGVAAYRRAVQADSTFALAWYRLSIAAEWLVRSDLAHEAAERAVQLAGRLPERDSLLLHAMLAGRRGEIEVAEPIYRQILGTHPEDIEAWVQLGELLFHYGPARGRPGEESREAWMRVAELEPDLVFPVVHLARLAARAGRRAELDSLARTLEVIRAGTPPTSEARSDLIEVQALQAFATRDQTAQARSLADLARASDVTVVITAWGIATWTEDLAGASRVAALLAAPRRAPLVRAVGEAMLGSLAASGGRWEAARAHFAAAEELSPPVGSLLAAYYALAPIGLAGEEEAARLVAAIPAVGRTDTTAAALEVASYYSIPHRGSVAVRLYLQGLARAAAGDAAGARQLAAAVERLPRSPGSPNPPMLAAGIRGEVAWVAGRVEEAQRELAGAHPRTWYLDAVSWPFVSGPRERWRLAEVLERAGRLEEAEKWFSSFAEYSTYDLPFLAPAHRRLALLAERRGDAEAARRHWARFAELWHDADPALQPLVAEARARAYPSTGTPIEPSR